MANVVLPFDGDFEALRRTLAAWGWEVGERPNAPLFASGPGVTLHAYRTGKVLLAGARAEEWARELRAEIAPRPTAPRPAAPRPAVKERAAPEPEPPAAGWTLHFDGACLPRNPGGVAAYGFVVAHDGRIVHEGHGLAAPPGPGATNNVAEFAGLVHGLRWIRERAKPGEPVRVRGDSRLVIMTVSGRWRVHVEHLRTAHAEAQRLARELGAKLEWVPRERNADADRLSEIGAAEAIRAHPEWGL